MAVFSLSSSAWLLICWAIFSTAVTLDGPHPLASLDDTIQCVRSCGFRGQFHRLPCYVDKCDLGFLEDTVLWRILTDLDSNPLFFTKIPPEFSDVQKRVKEFWEGPAPADINH